MVLDRRAVDFVRSLDEHDLRRLVMLARGLLATAGAPAFDDLPGEPAVRYRQRQVRCGKATCTRCPHGPYWYAYWREDGKLRSRYVGKSLPA